jgi:hypothetical protein
MTNTRPDSLPLGRPVIAAIRVAYAADRPVLLWGRHGIGKSQIFAAAARELQIDLRVIDLSLIDGVDLTGLPVVREQRTEYAVPALLPDAGRGLLLFEEMTRVNLAARGPCYQLLVARALNRYILPPGWLPCAAANPDEPDYDVVPLDAALRDRFCEIHCRADPAEWLRWAHTAAIHPAVFRLMEHTSGIFEEKDVTPRGWEAASKLLHQPGFHALGEPERLALLEGVLKNVRCAQVLERISTQPAPLRGREVFESYEQVRPLIKAWLAEGRTDLVLASARAVQRHLQAGSPEAIAGKEAGHRLQQFLDDIPGDLRHLVTR